MSTAHYLIVAHENPESVKQLIDALDSQEIYIHIDSRIEIQPFKELIPSAHFLVDRVASLWASWGAVEATLRLIQLALPRMKDGDYAILLSGDSYPLARRDEIEEFLSQSAGREFIECIDMADPIDGKGIFRIALYFRHYDVRAKGFKAELTKFYCRILRKITRRDWRKAFGELKPFGGSGWWALSKEAIEFLLVEYSNRGALTDFMRNTFCPDEHYLHTLIGNSRFKERIAPRLIFDRFSNGSPNAAILDPSDIEALRNSAPGRYLFARKVRSQEIRDLIESKLWR